MSNESMRSELVEPLPCPFCGHVGLDFKEGSTFRWLAYSCANCGMGSETRMQTMGEGLIYQWRKNAETLAIEEWNTRAAPPAALAQREEVSGAPDPVGQPAGEQSAALSGAPTSQRADEPVAWMNVKYGTFFGAGVIAATDRNDELIASGELIRLYAAPAAPAYVPLSETEALMLFNQHYKTTETWADQLVAFASAIESIVVARMLGEGK